jgi:predicted NAD/FAD-binding protein
MRVAVIGSGIAGLAAAHELRDHARVTLFEASAHFGGHAHTVDVTLPGPSGPITHGVDTGFLVFNERTYPRLIRLYEQLGVPKAPSEMSFSVQVLESPGGQDLEWSGASLSAVFAQKRNLLRPGFWSMLRDIVRFNALTVGIAQQRSEAALQQPLGEFLDEHRFGEAFRDWYFLPMMACIWSCPTRQMLSFPVSTMIRFCHNHGLLQISNRPQWYTVPGGSRNYVEQILRSVPDARSRTPVRRIERVDGGVMVSTDQGTEYFERAVLAVHTDQALQLLADPTSDERAILSGIRYQDNLAVLHTDASQLPRRQAAWAAWNYEHASAQPAGGASVCLHYLINRLQPLPWSQPVIVSLNPRRPIAAEHILGQYHYAHPVFDLAAMGAQQRVERLQGHRDTYFCGAWAGYGFHEDGLRSGQDAARQLIAEMQRAHRKAA